MSHETVTPLELSPEQRFDALRMRYEDHVELLRYMTRLDLQLFTGFMTIQLALGGWLATGPITAWLPLTGLLALDGALAAVGTILLRNNALRRKEAVATLKNVMGALGFYQPGFYSPGIVINAPGQFRLWGPWYTGAIAVAWGGVMLVAIAAFPSARAANQDGSLLIEDLGMTFLLGLCASLATVGLLWLWQHLRMRFNSRRYCGDWDQYTISTTTPRQLERDPENCKVTIRRRFGRPDVLHLRAAHAPPGQPDNVRVWEGDLVIDRSVHTHASIAWAYTSPPDLTEFGAYSVLLHDNGDLFVTPALPPLAGDYLRFVLRKPRGDGQPT